VTGPAPDVPTLVDDLIAIVEQRDRLHWLRCRRRDYDERLVEEIRRRAESVLRRDPREAGRRAQLGLVVAETIKDRPGRLRCLVARAKASILCGDSTPALDAIEDAEHLARALGDETLLAEVELLRLQPVIALEKYDEARAVGEAALEAFIRRGDGKGELGTRMALADLAFRMDRAHDALRHYARVDGLLPRGVPPQTRAALALNRANALVACNRHRAAERHFDAARRLFAAADCTHAVAQVDCNAAYGELQRGRYREALRRYADCERVFKEEDDQRHLAHIDLDRAEIHLHLNLAEDAAAFAASAETRFLTLGLVKERAQAAFVYARAADQRGDPNTATTWFERAERLFRELGLTERVVACLVAHADVHRRGGDRAAAGALALDARALVKARMHPLAAARVELLSARLLSDSGEAAAAVEAAEKVILACRRVHAPWLHIEAARIVGRGRAELGEFESAIAAYAHAIEEMERFRRGIPPDEYMAAFLAGQADLYDEIVALLVAGGQASRAFEYADRAKSRALADALFTRRGAVPDAPRSEWADARLAGLRERLNALYQELFRRDVENDVRAPTRPDGRDRAGAIEREIASLLRRRRLDGGDGGAFDPVDAPDLATIRAALEPGAAVLEYVVAEKTLFAFLVTSADVHVVRSPISAAEIQLLVDRFRARLTREANVASEKSGAHLRATREDLAELARLLVEPFRERLADVRRLVVVPHASLHQLPFHALAWDDGWLCDRFEIVYAPSAALHAACRACEPTAAGDAEVFGLPDESAPRIEAECRRVAAVIGPARLHLREAATFERLRTAAADARIVHIATHGMFRQGRPALSSFRLADGWVNLHDLRALTVRGELVVLSTCESGVADADRANDILGIARGFLEAGAPALLTAQWTVDDATTCRLMESFHEAMRDGMDAAAAHRHAMARAREVHPHPYYWAAFFLVGRPAPTRDALRTNSTDVEPVMQRRNAAIGSTSEGGIP